MSELKDLLRDNGLDIDNVILTEEPGSSLVRKAGPRLTEALAKLMS